MPATVTYRDGVRVLSLNGDGNPPYTQSADNEPSRATFACGAVNITPAATPTDFIVIRGAANKRILIKSIALSGLASVAGAILVTLVRRSAANTGASTAVAGVAHDTADGAAAATVNYYTANPSGLGTSAGVLHNGRLSVAPAANAVDRLLFQFTWQNDKAIVLSGANNFLAVNFNSTALPAGTVVDFDLTWTEENLV